MIIYEEYLSVKLISVLNVVTLNIASVVGRNREKSALATIFEHIVVLGAPV